jgi:hypothetical protein
MTRDLKMKNFALLAGCGLIAIATMQSCIKKAIVNQVKNLPGVFAASKIGVGDTITAPDSLCIYTLYAGTESITPPTGTVPVGQVCSVAYVATGLNGCAQTVTTNSIAAGNNIGLTPSVNYQGCICTQALVPMSATFTFTPSSAGVYTISALDGNNSIISATVQAQ